MENRLYKHFNFNLVLNCSLTFNSSNTKKLKKKINLGFSEIFSPSFQENNLLFNAFALKAITRRNPIASFNFKKKDFVRDHKIYKINLSLINFKFGLLSFHKLSNTLLPGIMIKKLSFKLNSFSKIKKFSFLIEDCLRNAEVSNPAFKSKYSTYYDVGFEIKSEVFFFFEFILRNCQIPLHMQEYKHFSYNNIRKNNLIYTL